MMNDGMISRAVVSHFMVATAIFLGQADVVI